MKNIKNWLGLCLMLFAVQVYANEISIKDVWVRPLHNGKDNMMVGMVVESDKHARITSIISPAYSSVVMWGPGKEGSKKVQEIEYIELPAQKAVELNENGAHLVLSGNHFKSMSNKITLIISAQLDDGSIKNITTVAYIEGSKAAEAPVKANSAETGSGAETKAAAVAAAAIAESALEKKGSESKVSGESSSAAKHAAAERKAQQEKKVVKSAPAPKPAPVHAVQAAPAPAPVPVAVMPAPAPAPAPAAVAAAAAEAHALAEAKKELEAKLAEKTKQEEAETRAECIDLARALRECDKANDMMQEMCVNNAQSDSSCKLPLAQVRKLR